MLKCNCCGSTDISDEPEIKHPEGCVCWEDWLEGRTINPICNSFKKDEVYDECANCIHDEECHKRVK